MASSCCIVVKARFCHAVEGAAYTMDTGPEHLIAARFQQVYAQHQSLKKARMLEEISNANHEIGHSYKA
eukprot:6188505-Pleurochrysis_carterae.AAC.2